jgi:hypothetical protein
LFDGFVVAARIVERSAQISVCQAESGSRSRARAELDPAGSPARARQSLLEMAMSHLIRYRIEGQRVVPDAFHEAVAQMTLNCGFCALGLPLASERHFVLLGATGLRRLQISLRFSLGVS